MAPVIRLALAALLVTSAPAYADQATRWRTYIDEASVRFGIPTRWINQVIRAESGGRTLLNGHPIRSRKGAIGLMQLMPATWTAMRARLGLGADPDDPRDNILAGTFYLRLMYDRFGYPGLFAAYNAGPAAYAGYLAGTKALPAETMAYLGSVGGTAQPVSSTAQSALMPTLFAVRRTVPADPIAPTGREQQASLFAVRNAGS
ncbi:MAG TPA: lytic transglycosylase domain-containing protein [Sphingomonas sp.]|nr:lytic transglycosylase domain-containing protein [Sphingomonas sp.]